MNTFNKLGIDNSKSASGRRISPLLSRCAGVLVISISICGCTSDVVKHKPEVDNLKYERMSDQLMLKIRQEDMYVIWREAKDLFPKGIKSRGPEVISGVVNGVYEERSFSSTMTDRSLIGERSRMFIREAEYADLKRNAQSDWDQIILMPWSIDPRSGAGTKAASLVSLALSDVQDMPREVIGYSDDSVLIDFMFTKGEQSYLIRTPIVESKIDRCGKTLAILLKRAIENSRRNTELRNKDPNWSKTLEPQHYPEVKARFWLESLNS